MTEQPTSPLGQLLLEYSHERMLAPLAAQSPLVPPEGLAESPLLMLVGEAPGKDEVRLGRPFVGKAGEKLDRALRNSDIPRRFCWITNVVLYRPPGNRTPYPYEVATSRPRLTAEIALVRPTMVVALGGTAWAALDRFTESPELHHEQARGKLLALHARDYQCPLLVTWHPAAAFHNHEAESELTDHLRSLRAGASA